MSNLCRYFNTVQKVSIFLTTPDDTVLDKLTEKLEADAMFDAHGDKSIEVVDQFDKKDGTSEIVVNLYSVWTFAKGDFYTPDMWEFWDGDVLDDCDYDTVKHWFDGYDVDILKIKIDYPDSVY